MRGGGTEGTGLELGTVTSLARKHGFTVRVTGTGAANRGNAAMLDLPGEGRPHPGAASTGTGRPTP